MKSFMSDFVRRGLVACGLGPVVLAVVYLILHRCGVVDSLSVDEMCTGIFSLAALAFVAGGLNALYRIERMPLMAAVTVHGGALYLGYLATYLLNGWLSLSKTPVLVFSAIFVVGYLAVRAVIYASVHIRTQKLNQALKQKHRP